MVQPKGGQSHHQTDGRGEREGLEREWVREGRQKDFQKRRKEDDKADGGGWHRVEGRKKRRFTSYFFTRIPDNFDAVAMSGVFNKYGKVKEVVIPFKRMKNGQRFGFVRFWDVLDPKYFERKLDNIIIGCSKINVNLPRFGKETVNMKKVESRKPPPKPMLQFATRAGKVQTGRSFKDALNGDKGCDVNSDVQGNRNSGKEKQIEIDDEIAPWLRNSLVGKVKNVELMNSIHDHLILEGINCIRVRYLGDNFVLLTGEDGANVDVIWNHDREWLDGIFESISPWSPETALDHRLVWIRCEGIPLHLWKVSFFKEITKEVGEVIAVDGDTRDFRKVDGARLCVRTSEMAPIFIHYNMKIKEVTYNIRLLEELPSYGSCNGCRESSFSQSDGSKSPRWPHLDDEFPPSPPGSPGSDPGGGGGDLNSKGQNLNDQEELGDVHVAVGDSLILSKGVEVGAGLNEEINVPTLNKGSMISGSDRGNNDEELIVCEEEDIISNNADHSGVGGAQLANPNLTFGLGWSNISQDRKSVV